MRENRKRSAVYLASLAAGILSAAGCRQSGPISGDVTAKPTSSAAISVVHPQRQAVKRVVEQPGTIQAYEETQLFARVPGYIRLFHDRDGRILHDIGRKIRGPKYDASGKEVVEPGEILAELVVPELEQEAKLKKAMVRQAQAEVEQAQKALASAQANIATAEAAVAEARALNERWESESRRIAGLVKSGTIDEQSRDETRYQFKAAAAHVLSTEAAVRKAKAGRDKAMADVRSAEAHVDVARADTSRAQAMLGYAKIRAPFDGIVILRKANTGDFVQPTGGQGDWLFKVARIDPVRVVIAVPEADAGLVQDGSEVKLNIQALPGPSLSGSVARTSWALEPGARTLRAEIDLPNKDGRLRPGMYVYAQIINQMLVGWVLPTSAVVKQGDATVCFLIDGGKAVRTPVQVGRGDGQFIQVLKRQKSGSSSSWEEFTGNENVAASGGGLTDGQVAVSGD